MGEAVFSVAQINQAVAAALQESFPEPFWVAGEIQGYERDALKAAQRSWGQVYFEMVEKEDGADAVRARAKALMWGDAARRVAQRLGEVRLTDGLQVKFLCAVDFFWKTASFQLKVLDVDPEFTVGGMEKARRALVERLKRDNLFDANRAVPLPALPLTVGLITSEGSAAFHDFLHELRASGLGFTVLLADARMQGEETEPSVLRALSALEADPAVDVIALVRGGGSRSDLMWFDREGISLAVAGCGKPVVTGIGHEIDLSVADLVAHAAHKTPSACARFLVERVRAFDAGVREAGARVMALARDRLEGAGADLRDAVHHWRRGAAAGLQRAQAILSGARQGLGQGARRHLGLRRERLRTAPSSLRRGASAILSRAEERLGAFQKECAFKDPARLLARGYSLIYKDGRLIKSAAAVAPGEAIEARLSDGRIDASVTRTS